MSEEYCGNCRYWKKQEEESGRTIVEGDCRRYPPTMPVLCGESQLGIQQWLASSLYEDTLLTAFPRTFDEEWCGEWREKEHEVD